jgi:hypothetical protein
MKEKFYLSPSVQLYQTTVRFPLRDDPYWNSRENSLELMGLSSINKVSLV